LAQAESGDVPGAMQTAGTIGFDKRRKNEALKDIALAQARQGNFAGARQKLQSIDAANDFNHYLFNTGYQQLAEIQARKGDIAGAEASLSSVISPEPEPPFAQRALLVLSQAYLATCDAPSSYLPHVRAPDASSA